VAKAEAEASAALAATGGGGILDRDIAIVEGRETPVPGESRESSLARISEPIIQIEKDAQGRKAMKVFIKEVLTVSDSLG